METHLCNTTKDNRCGETDLDDLHNYLSVMFTDFPDMLSIPQAAKALNCSQYSVRMLVRTGELHARLVRGTYRIPKSSLFEYTYGSPKQSHTADTQPIFHLVRRAC